VATTIFCLVVGADRYGAEYENKRYDVGKINTEATLEQRLGIDPHKSTVDLGALSFKDRFVEIEWCPSDSFESSRTEP
jgi:hypothetical protein